MGHPRRRCHPGRQPEPAETCTRWPCGPLLHLDRVRLQKAGRFIRHLAEGEHQQIWLEFASAQDGEHRPDRTAEERGYQEGAAGPNRKVKRAVRKTNPLKNIRTML